MNPLTLSIIALAVLGVGFFLSLIAVLKFLSDYIKKIKMERILKKEKEVRKSAK